MAQLCQLRPGLGQTLQLVVAQLHQGTRRQVASNATQLDFCPAAAQCLTTLCHKATKPSAAAVCERQPAALGQA